MAERVRTDVLIFGGGASGLWCLDRFRRAGYDSILLESKALGCGQTIQAQGIIHGGGKYALRGVRDFAAVRATKEMPDRWRRSLAGDLQPNLNGVRLLSSHCHLWLPRGSFASRLLASGFMSVLAQAGLLATPAERLRESAWPEALRGSALAVYALAEPVIATGSFLEAIAGRHRKHIYLYDPSGLDFSREGVRAAEVLIEPRITVLAAGEGNGTLLRKAGIEGDRMQRRPLGMALLKGDLPPLFGHCVANGKTALTVTTPAEGVWQVGGEIAERLALENNEQAARTAAIEEIGRRLPGFNFSAVQIALYRAVRAEARTAEQKRPSGVHVSRAGPSLIVAWPTKLALAPVLADEVFSLASADLRQPAGYGGACLPWPAPPLATYPWEEVEWLPVR